VLVVGFALVVYLPTPQERAFSAYNELFQIKIKSTHWKNIAPGDAVGEINQEMQKVSHTPYRLIFAEGANNAILSYELELHDTPVAELARYITELTGNEMYQTPKGIVIDQREREGYFDGRTFCEPPSWRKDVRDWVEYGLLWRLRHWCGIPDPVVPSPLSQPTLVDPFGPAPGQSTPDPFAPSK
jgi:hypothetical protein